MPNMNPEKHREQSREAMRRQRMSEKGRRSQKSAQLMKKYGISLEEFEGMIKLQNGMCALCFRPLSDAVLDHCHTTGLNRGVIHRKCNVAIGQLEDNPRLLRLAAEYLEKFQCQ